MPNSLQLLAQALRERCKRGNYCCTKAFT